MDALTDILRSVHLQGSVYCRSELSAPWGFSVPKSERTQFHVVRRGRCWLLLEGARRTEPVLLEAGDLVLLPCGSAHVMADSLKTRALPLERLIREHLPPDGGKPLVYGGRGEGTTLVCGYFDFARGTVHPLLSVLPTLVTIRGEGGRAHSWLESTLDLIAEESTAGRPGGETLIDRLTETLFVHVLRRHLEQPGPPNPSWLLGLRDPNLAGALGLIHRQPEQAWTVATLAQRVGMSRSAFAARFRAMVGDPPLVYLTRWRMQLAADKLRASQLNLSDVAEQVGYQTEASFSKVFKRLWGVAPATYRRRALGQAAPE